MKILLVGHTYLAANNRAKLRSLARQGIRLNVLLPSNWRHRGDVVYRGEIYDAQGGVDEFGFLPRCAIRPGHIASHLFSPVDVWRALTTVRPDLVHIENEGYSYLAGEIVPIAKTLGVKTTLFVWENIDKAVHWSQRICRGVSLSLVSGLVCGSSGAQEQYRGWGFKGPTTIVPQLGIDMNEFRPLNRKVRSAEFVVGYVGRLVPEKGVDVLLRAVSRLADSGVSIQCVIEGSGPARNDLMTLAGQLHIERFTSFGEGVPQDKVPEVLQKLDVLVLPSKTASHWKEQLGHILLEAMSVGAVVVGSRSGAIPEVIEKEELLFEENDHVGLEKIILKLATNAKFYRECRAFGLDRVRSTYTHEIVASKLAGFWRSLDGCRL